MIKKKKVIAIASVGGHWIQLLRIVKPLEKEFDIIYISTHKKCSRLVEGHIFYCIRDFSRWDFYKLVPEFFRILNILHKEKPDVVITTGAAPGLICLLAAKLCVTKTVWIDSIANVEHLSFSGRIAIKFAQRVYTQWHELETEKVRYVGNIFN